MKSERALRTGTSRYLSTGPLVWAATIACTTLLLVLLKQALWFVVPFLLAIILYYALFPAVRRLTLAGMERESRRQSLPASSSSSQCSRWCRRCRGSRRRR
jgi:hypothetical protein